MDLGKLFVANRVTIATRVRSDILRAIAHKCSNEKEEMCVIGFTSRPVLQTRRRDNSGQFAMTFTDTVAKFGARLTKGSLEVAYGRAGESFNGQLQQNFVVLHDGVGVKRAAAAAGPTMGRGMKRGNEDGEAAGEPKWLACRGKDGKGF